MSFLKFVLRWNISFLILVFSFFLSLSLTSELQCRNLDIYILEFSNLNIHTKYTGCFSIEDTTNKGMTLHEKIN